MVTSDGIDSTDSISGWQKGRFDARRSVAQLLFGQQWEDASIECVFFPPGAKVFTIASAGCTSFALAKHGCDVVTCDINPRQIEYVERRFAGGPLERGLADRLLGVWRFFASCLGITWQTRCEFVELSNPAAQATYWRQHFDRPRLRRLLRWLLNPRVLRSVYAPRFIQTLPDDFADVLWRRLARGFATHPNRNNPFARRLLLGDDSPIATIAGGIVATVCNDACRYLEQCEPHTFDGISLSNILDGAALGYGGRLDQALQHAARPDATILLRSVAEPLSREEEALATRDRSLFWGRIIACRPVDFLTHWTGHNPTSVDASCCAY